MPFKSQAQVKYMFAKHPGIAKEFAKKTENINNLPKKAKQLHVLKKTMSKSED